MCSASLHISFKAHSSGKLLKQNKPIRNFFMCSNAPYNPWNIYPVIPDQRRTRRHKIKRRSPKTWQRVQESQRMTISDKASPVLDTPQTEARSSMHVHPTQLAISHREPRQPPKPRSSKARAQWCKGTDVQTPAGPGPALSAQRTEHLHGQHASEHWELDHPQVYSCPRAPSPRILK